MSGSMFRSALLSTVLLATAGITGCASSAPAVEKDDGFDFAAVSTYAWVTDEPVLITFGDDQPNVRTKENELRIRAAVERELAARGLEKSDASEARLLVAFSVGTRMRYRLEGGDRTSNFTDGPGQKQTQGTLNIYLLDRETDREVWHGSMSKWLRKTDDPDAIINGAVGKIMSVFP
ncbi:MAG: DUF4136 domain-containing protein [Nannocystales bacterium]